ncbi:hypothetical protein PZE06_20470 [Robertmurraya sp. DFI.2.37]|uniref:hypothetical protein n=1 Tax=Robertmurraya sp. DFI.2.37 TaxID=3031819 RepID=UPI0012449702|nr:hypothetical protein [Robertmurraya sp. DFI.2.37]MDF1510512.1 hypothetical protein [Robertmurraya sp. DFI.2.37]
MVNRDFLQQHYLFKTVEVAIQDIEGVERAPFVQKEIKKIGFCPDQTHLRIYFEHQNFFAIPLNAEVIIESDNWTAIDRLGNLKYIIRRVRVS